MRRKLILSVLLLACCVASLTILTTAWIRRTWAPEFNADQIEVETSGSLVINLAGDDYHEPLSKVTLNDLFDVDDFYLKQVSNCTGESSDFFKIDYGDGVAGSETIVHLTRTDTYTNLGKNNGYIEGTFFLAGLAGSSGTAKYIYIDKNSVLESLEDSMYDVTDAIRISITIHGAVSKTYIIKKGDKEHTAITNEMVDDVYVASGQLLYTSISPKVVNESVKKIVTNTAEETLIYNFSDLDGYDEADPTTFQTDEILFMMNANETKQITIRVWLEGFDPACTDEISGHRVRLQLIFKSHDVVLEPEPEEGE